MGNLAPLIVAGLGDNLAVDGAGQVIRSPQVVGVVVGMQLALLVQQGRRTSLDTLHNHAQPGLIAVDIAVGKAVALCIKLLLHQFQRQE